MRKHKLLPRDLTEFEEAQGAEKSPEPEIEKSSSVKANDLSPISDAGSSSALSGLRGRLGSLKTRMALPVDDFRGGGGMQRDRDRHPSDRSSRGRNDPPGRHSRRSSSPWEEEEEEYPRKRSSSPFSQDPKRRRYSPRSPHDRYGRSRSPNYRGGSSRRSRSPYHDRNSRSPFSQRLAAEDRRARSPFSERSREMGAGSSGGRFSDPRPNSRLSDHDRRSQVELSFTCSHI